jgi:hypothetical protein
MPRYWRSTLSSRCRRQLQGIPKPQHRHSEPGRMRIGAFRVMWVQSASLLWWDWQVEVPASRYRHMIGLLLKPPNVSNGNTIQNTNPMFAPKLCMRDIKLSYRTVTQRHPSLSDIAPSRPVSLEMARTFASSSADWQVRGKAETTLRDTGFPSSSLALPFRAFEAVNVQPYLASRLCRGTRARAADLRWDLNWELRQI